MYYKKIAITNRAICGRDFFEQLERLASGDWQSIILREKDLSEDEYFLLAKKALEACGDKLVIHTYPNVAERLGCKKIHLPMPAFRQLKDKRDFIIGVSAHSLDEVLQAQRGGAAYATVSPIFATDCKRDVVPKGLEYLKSICTSVNIPVYALGGISEENAEACIKMGAEGVCMMSQAMKA